VSAKQTTKGKRTARGNTGARSEMEMGRTAKEQRAKRNSPSEDAPQAPTQTRMWMRVLGLVWQGAAKQKPRTRGGKGRVRWLISLFEI
jgi:hypothetical protein